MYHDECEPQAESRDEYEAALTQGSEPMVMTDAEADRAEMELAFSLEWLPFDGMTATEWLRTRDTLATV